MSERTGAPMTSEQTRTPAQQVEKTVVCTKCGHPVWFMAEEREATTCTDCGTVNLRAQPDISETDDEEFATAALVAALADTVAEQEQTLDDWTHLVHARLETHSHRISQSNSMLVKAVTELCDLVDWLAVGTVHMIGVDACSQINERTAALRALESSASAPEPVCPTCKGENDCQIEARYPNGDGCGYFKDCPDCDGTGFVPVEPTAAVPDAGAALDSMRLALIRLLNMLTLTQVNALGEDDMKLIFGKVGDVQIEEHLQAYGKPGANPKLVVPEKTVAIRAYGRDGAR